MKIKDKNFLGYTIPTVPNQTTNFNNSSYGELDIVNSFFRGTTLKLNTGKDSNNQKYYCLKIEGIGDVEKEIGYYSDALLVWGKWAFISPTKESQPDLDNDFIGVVTGLKKGMAIFYLEMHPEKK